MTGRIPSLLRSLGPLLAHPRIPLLAALIAVAVCSHALWNGFQSDDYVHRVSLLRIKTDIPMLVGEPMDIFSFVPENPERTRAIVDFGVFPWWTHPEIRLSLFRPLTALTHMADYALWPDGPMMMHAHNLLWYGLLVWITALLYQRLMGAGVAAGLAALFYALDDAHGFGAGWLANRNAVVCASLGLGSVLLHDIWRTGRNPLARVAAVACFAAGLLGGEGAVAAGPYLLGYALFMDDARRRESNPLLRKLMTLWPYVLVGVLYLAAYRAGKYGARLSGVYVDPVGEPLKFLVMLARNAPVLLLGQLGLPPADVAALLAPGARIAWSATAAVIVGVGCRIARPWLAGSPVARMFALGTLLSVLPISATFASNRILFFVGFGGLGLAAMLVERIAAGEPGRPARMLAWAMIVIHGVLGPLMLPMFVLAFRMPQQMMDRVTQSFPFEEPGLAEKRVVLLRSPSPLALSFIPIEAALKTRPMPLSMRALASSSDPLEVERLDDRTLRIRPMHGFNPGIERVTRGGAFLPVVDLQRILVMLDSLFRDPALPFRVGEKIELNGMTIEITQLTEDGRAGEAIFRFDRPLEDSSLLWLDWEGGLLVKSAPPAPGAKMVLERAGLAL